MMQQKSNYILSSYIFSDIINWTILDTVKFLYKKLILCDFKGISIYHYTQNFVLKATQISHSYSEIAA